MAIWQIRKILKNCKRDTDLFSLPIVTGETVVDIVLALPSPGANCFFLYSL